MLEIRNNPDSLTSSIHDKSKPLRVAILSYRSDPMVGGQGVYIDYLTSALVETGAIVDVISGPPYPTLSSNAQIIKIPSLDLYAQPHNGHFSLRPKHLLSPTDTYEYFGHLSGKFVEPYTFGQRALAYLRKHRSDYDVVLDNQTLATGIEKIRSVLGIPLATVIHHPITKDRKLAIDAASSFRQRLLARRWYAFHHMQVRVARRLPAITCPSEHAKKDIVKEFGVDEDRIQPILLGVDQVTYTRDPSIERVPRRIITTASADTPLKGLHILIEAYHRILQSNPDTELVVIGKLRKGAAYRAIKKSGLEDKVQFKSDLTRAELANEFRRAAVAVTPSVYEGFGLPAAEAMSCGTPVIVTDGGALPEVAGDAGLIVPKGSPAPLATAIAELLDNLDRRTEVAEACYRRSQTHFNWKHIAPKYLKFFNSVIAEQC